MRHAIQTDLSNLRMWMGRLSIACIAVPGAILIYAALSPLSLDPQISQASRPRELKPLPRTGEDISPLVEKVVVRELIKPAQIKSAVKDDGAAAKLLSKLKLQGVVQSQSSFIAYIRVEEKSVKTVKRGDKL